MLSLDITALRERFLSTVATTPDLAIVYANQPLEKPDNTAIWCRFTILPGLADLFVSGFYRQLGIVELQVFVPEGEGTTTGWEIAELFEDAFLNWRSDDGAMRIYQVTKGFSPTADGIQLSVMAEWSSTRPQTG
jgi:hypothetical protein